MLVAALTSLSANKLRSFLTMLGILIGVASIITIMALGSGGQAAIVSAIESSRMQRTIQVIPREITEPGLPQPGDVLSFSSSDFEVARQFDGVESVYYTLYGEATVAARDTSLNVSVEAGPAFLDEIGHFVVVRGRMFSQADLLAHRRVALLSQTLAGKLFGNLNPIGRVINVGHTPVQVIGVTASTQANLLAGLFGADYLYMPSTTCLDLFPWWTISEMDVEVKPGVDKAELSRRLIMALNIHAHNAQAFVDSSGLLLGLEQLVGRVTSILTLVIGSVAGIALVVGGVGVMNIMLVSVTERTQEIGIRMSLGATRRAILLQFLMESATITLIGGSLGVILGLLAAWAVRLVTHFPTMVSWPVIAGSVVFSAFIGVVCGLYPANKAARLNPIDALRYE
ncbi:MAG: ABC transporter permease [Alicyclobacillaceae bacterium]|nr:ABC transporter permease [Alicyclobacillaceae bacterium]